MNSSLLIVIFAFLLFFLILRWYYAKNLGRLLYKLKKNRFDAEEIAKTPKNTTFSKVNQELDLLLEDRKTEIDRLEKLEVYRKEFLGNVSHELKTPIFNIQGYVSTLLDGGLEDETINRDYLMRAERSVERMIRIVDDLEAIAQLESGQLQLELEKFDIVALIKEVFETQEMTAQKKGISLSLKYQNQAPIEVLGDKFRIRQVVTNLIVNSIKYGRENGKTIIWFQDLNDGVLIEVFDNGIGVDPVHLPRLFERFYRIDKHRSREGGGTGLGLAIVKHILEAHGQTITVSSNAGVGTVFSFTLKKA